MGFKGHGTKASVLRKTLTTSRGDSLSINKARKYLYGVANKRGYALHGMSKWSND